MKRLFERWNRFIEEADSKEMLQETTFVDPKGRAVDLSLGRLSPRERILSKYYATIRSHPSEEFREKAEKLRLKSINAATPEEREEAKKQYHFYVDMSNHQDETIRKFFLSDDIAFVNQALHLALVYPPDKTPIPELTDDEEFEQGIYDDFDTPDGYGEHNYPSDKPSIENYDEIFDNLLKKAIKRVQNAFDSGEENQTELAYIAANTPGLRQTWDKFGYDLEDLNYIPEMAVEEVVGEDNLEDLGYDGRLEESKTSKVTKSYIRRLVKEEIRKMKSMKLIMESFKKYIAEQEEGLDDDMMTELIGLLKSENTEAVIQGIGMAEMFMDPEEIVDVVNQNNFDVKTLTQGGENSIISKLLDLYQTGSPTVVPELKTEDDYEILRSYKIPSEALAILAHAKDEKGKLASAILMNPNIDSDIIEDIIKNMPDEFLKLNDALTGLNLVVANPDTTPLVLTFLTGHHSKYTRNKIANHPNATVEVLRLLQRDEYLPTRRAARNRLKKMLNK
jgi:hypothetical protein